MTLSVSESIKQVCPNIRLGIIRCDVRNSETNSDFWQEMETEIQNIASEFSIEEINKRPAIAATRQVYKLLGKDPNRYRPSAEALCRRIVRGIDIYKVSTLVDIINLVSIRSGFSIGGFDADKVQGDVELGVGTNMDVFEAIGRGLLNIEGLPVFRDRVGGIGTPTSDNERTKLSLETNHLLMFINAYNGGGGLTHAIEHARELLEKYADMTYWEAEIFSV
jgi:DNA/RNA-binding domain of Phe-tRNA-synthetase-like protein